MNKIIIDEKSEKIGFYYEDNNIILQVPKFYSLKKLDTKEEYLSFYKILIKYSKDVKNQKLIKEDENIHKVANQSLDLKEFSFFEAIFSLLEDYTKNGFISFKKKECNNYKHGNINWQKTLQKSKVFVLRESVIYENYFYNNFKYNYSHEITLLHIFTIKKVYEYFGLKTNTEMSVDFNYLKSNMNIEKVLKNYENQIFSDREKKVINLLNVFWKKKYLTNVTKGNNKLSFISKFDSVWEIMLKKSLRDDFILLKDMIPKGFYNIFYNGIEKKMTGINLIPDILLKEIYKNEEILIIIDAKNYAPDFDEGKGMPMSSDIGKQILYKYLLSSKINPKSKYTEEKIVNCFFIPKILEKSKIEYIGVHHIEALTNCDNKIYCFFCDFIELRKNYLAENDSYRKEIVKYILEKIND